MSREFRMSPQSGSVVFLLMAGILPLLFVLLAAVIDVGAYYSSFRRNQQLADEAALYAERFLPFSEAAEQALLSFLEGKGVARDNIDFEISNDRIRVQLTHSTPLVFSRFFDDSRELNTAVVSGARVAPLSVSVVFDIGQTLAPSLSATGAWDYPTGAAFPVAGLFENLELRFEENGVVRSMRPEVASAQCFNPLLNAVKRSALRLFEFYSASDGNNLSLMAGPLQGGLIANLLTPDTYRMPASEESSPFAYHRYQGLDPSGQLGGVIKGDYCLAAAERAVQPELQFPGAVAVPGRWIPAHTTEPLTYPDTHLFSQNYEPFLNASQVVWGQVVNPDERLTVQSAFGFLESQLFVPHENASRGGLVNKTKHLGFLLLGDLPSASRFGARFPAGGSEQQLREFLSRYRQNATLLGREVELVVALFELPSASGRVEAPPETAIESFASILQEFATPTAESDFSASFVRVSLEGTSSAPAVEQFIAMHTSLHRSPVLWH